MNKKVKLSQNDPLSSLRPAFNYKCEDCRDTGWYGDNGPGIKGNNEYNECDCQGIRPDHIKQEIKSLEKELARKRAELQKTEDSLATS